MGLLPVLSIISSRRCNAVTNPMNRQLSEPATRRSEVL